MLEVRGVQKEDRRVLVSEREGAIDIDLGLYASVSLGPQQARHVAAALYDFAARVESREA